MKQTDGLETALGAEPRPVRVMTFSMMIVIITHDQLNFYPENYKLMSKSLVYSCSMLKCVPFQMFLECHCSGL